MAYAYTLYVIFTIILQTVRIESTGKIAVKVTRYQNPNGRDEGGNCCDGITLEDKCPTGSCDNSFSLCASNKNNSMDDTDCSYGKHKFSAIKDQNSNTFTEDDVTMFFFDTWAGSVSLIIRVTDLDSDGEKDIDIFSVTFASAVFTSETTATYKNFELTGSRQKNPTKLSVSVTAYCDKYYYRSDCSKRCVGQDKCDGHYSCDDKGDIVCIPGWTGNNCTQEVKGSAIDCDVDLGKSTWSGNISCNKSVQAVSIAFSGNGKVAGSLGIQGETVGVYGLFNATTEKVILATNKSSSSSVDLQNIVATRVNRTRLIGAGTLNGETCEINLLKTLSLSDVCGYDGTCVRFGQRSGDIYCCCKDGQMATNCGMTSTMSTTRTTLLQSTSTSSSSTTIPTTTEVTTQSITVSAKRATTDTATDSLPLSSSSLSSSGRTISVSTTLEAMLSSPELSQNILHIALRRK